MALRIVVCLSSLATLAAAISAPVVRDGSRKAAVIAEARTKKAASFLQEKGQKLGNSEMEALALKVDQEASSSNPDGMEQVKGLLRQLLVSAKQQHAEETGLHQFCSEEVAKSKQSLTDMQDRQEKAQADFDKLSAQIDETKLKISDLHADVAATQKSLVTAADLRAKELAQHEKDQAAEQETENKHRAIHNQMDTEDPGRPAEEAKADAALQRRIKLENEEASRVYAFERTQKESQTNIQVKQHSIQLNERALVKMKADLVEQRQDLAGLNEQMSAAKSYEESIARKCTVPVDSHAERARRREEQIDSLKDAYQILNGDAVPVLSF